MSTGQSGANGYEEYCCILLGANDSLITPHFSLVSELHYRAYLHA